MRRLSRLAIGAAATAAIGFSIQACGGGGGGDDMTGGTGGTVGMTGGTGGTLPATGGMTPDAAMGGAGGAGGMGGTMMVDAGTPDTMEMVDAPPPLPDGPIQAILGGTFRLLASHTPMANSDSWGHAILLKNTNTTEVQVSISGLTPNTAYPAHVHAGDCNVDGLGHYKIDPSVGTAEEANEIWPAFTTDSNGFGQTSVNVQHVVRGDALSVIVHDPAMSNAKMLCADLAMSEPLGMDATATGTFAPFAGAEAGDQTITGTATLVRHFSAPGELRNTITIDVMGLSAAATYASHVHALPCDVMDAGPHYKHNPKIMDTEESNELWPTIADYADGNAQDTLTYNGFGFVREDAQSIVIHRVTGNGSPKVACADLKRAEYPDKLTNWGQTLPGDHISNMYAQLIAIGKLERNVDGTTTGTISVAGLNNSTEYPVHVHNQPCSEGDGGSHYKIDPGNAMTVEENEMWLTFTTDSAQGAATEIVEFMHMARPEAQSIVIHEMSNGSRITCVDLEAQTQQL